jgi:hypothetical protein
MANIVKFSKQASSVCRYVAGLKLTDKSFTTSEQKKNPPVIVGFEPLPFSPYLTNYPLLSYVDVTQVASKTRNFSTSEQRKNPITVSVEPAVPDQPTSSPYFSNYPLLSYVDVTQKAEQDNDSYTEEQDLSETSDQ